MRETPAPGKPFGMRLYFEDGEIERICGDALHSADCLPGSPAPVEIELFVEISFGCRAVYDNLPTRVLGAAAFGPDGTVEEITVARSLAGGGKVAERRARTTWAHEAGHALLHGTLFAQAQVGHPVLDGCFDYERRRILCRARDIGATGPNYDGRWWEWQANQAIGALLLPERLVLECVDSFTEVRGMLGRRALPSAHRERAARQLSEVFDVNPAAARIRLEGLFPSDAQQVL